ncbi:MAG: preprotein translocase subunit Sec61beta [Methanospirillum sp.]|uniref:preprotein translocase subunit Sec61beta n=1 Tax=Methanospirillum sp. TaxID=45200 RepID=UPI0023721331|nr:preprotein translocase subunit Sec61beta [Methanospirillum sp.]MDD1728384.1 preprotein translocase subunit Sec61beta [Methanospirillum sp.]
MAKKSGGRLISSAGLVNYYDSEDRRAVHISPYVVLGLTVGVAIIIFAANLIKF